MNVADESLFLLLNGVGHLARGFAGKFRQIVDRSPAIPEPDKWQIVRCGHGEFGSSGHSLRLPGFEGGFGAVDAGGLGINFPQFF